MYVAVKGGEKAISAAHELLRREGRGDPSVPALGIEQLIGQLRLAVDRVMAEGSLYDRDLAALAIKQAQGDLVEAVFLVRAYRTTLPRFGSSLAVDTSAMRVLRRISATWKDLPGGQILGATFDYTHRLLDRSLSRAEAGAAESSPLPVETDADSPLGGPLPRALDALVAEGLLERPAPSEDGAPASLWNCPPMTRRIAACAFRRWPAPTKGFCSAWPIPHSAASALCIPSPGNCAGDGWKCPFSPKSSASMSLSAKSS